MNKFLKYILIVLGAFCFLDLCNRCVFTYLFNHMPPDTETYNNLKFKYNTETCDVLVLGASRAQHHFVPRIFVDSLNMSCYNAGVDGQPITDQYMELLHSLDLGTPKIVIMDIATSQLEEEWVKERNSCFSLFYWENEECRQIVNDISGRENVAYISHLSSFYQYNSQLFLLYDLFLKKRHSLDHGYDPKPYKGKPFSLIKNKQDSQFIPYPPAIRYLDKIVILCQQKNIPLIFTVTPSLSPAKSGFSDFIEAYCKQKRIPFWNDAKDSTFRSDPYIWYDGTHMNEQGAERYTRMIMGRIKRMSISDKPV